MGTHLKALSERNPMKTNMTGLRLLSVPVLWGKLASALEGLMPAEPHCVYVAGLERKRNSREHCSV